MINNNRLNQTDCNKKQQIQYFWLEEADCMVLLYKVINDFVRLYVRLYFQDMRWEHLQAVDISFLGYQVASFFNIAAPTRHSISLLWWRCTPPQHNLQLELCRGWRWIREEPPSLISLQRLGSAPASGCLHSCTRWCLQFVCKNKNKLNDPTMDFN